MTDATTSYRRSPPINARGDRLVLPQEPGAIERLLNHRLATCRAEAEERARTMLEARLPAVVEILTDAQLVELVDVVVGAANAAVRERDAYVGHVLAGVLAQVPALVCFPDPRETPVVQPLPGGADSDPLVLTPDTDG